MTTTLVNFLAIELKIIYQMLPPTEEGVATSDNLMVVLDCTELPNQRELIQPKGKKRNVFKLSIYAIYIYSNFSTEFISALFKVEFRIFDPHIKFAFQTS